MPLYQESNIKLPVNLSVNKPHKTYEVPDFEIKLMVKSKSAEDKDEPHKSSPTIPSMTLTRCESETLFNTKSSRPRFMNSKIKSKSNEKTVEDIKELLENVPKNCPNETIQIFLDFIKKGLENIKKFVETIIFEAIHTEKRYHITTYAEILKSLLDSKKDPQGKTVKEPVCYVVLLKRCLLRKIQDLYEDQSLLMMAKEQNNEANDLEKSLHKLLFLEFMKALYRVGVLKGSNIRNSLVLLLVIFFNDNARLKKINIKSKIPMNLKTRSIDKNVLLEFRLNFTLELILSFLQILFKSKSTRNHEYYVERLKKENYCFYEDFFCQSAHEEQLIHNFSKDLLKIFNIFKENYDVSWLIIKEIFTVNNDYLIIMENDVQKLKGKFILLENIAMNDTDKKPLNI